MANNCQAIEKILMSERPWLERQVILVIRSPISIANHQCHVNVNYDPHVSVVYVLLDDEEPQIKLDFNNVGEHGWNKQGDSKAITVICDAAVQDEGPEPKVAADST